MRIRPLFSFLVMTSVLFSIKSQQINVHNEATGHPVSDVFIYNEDNSDVAYTNLDGSASLAGFTAGIITLQHPSFHHHTIRYTGENLSVALKEKIIPYNDIVVSANKWEQSEEDISQQIFSVDRKTIAFSNPQTSADLLNNTGQVFLQKSQLGGGSPKIRGFAANAVLLVVDGVRMNNAIFRSGNLQNIINIDPNAVSSSEVVFGPGSVIYGSDALGGVMDFHTIEPKWATDSVVIFKANALTRYSTAANERTGHVDFSFAKKKFTFFHSTSYTALGDLRSGSKRFNGYEDAFERNFYVDRIEGADALVVNDDPDVQRFSGYHLFNTISKARFRLGQNVDLTYGFYHSTTSDIPRYDNLTETIADTDSLANAEWYYGPQEWTMHNVKINYYHATQLFDQAKMTMGYQQFEESRNDRAFADDRLRVRTENVSLYSLSFDFDKEVKASNVYYGLDFYHNDVQSSAFRRNITTGEISATDTRYPDGGSTYTSLAAYSSLIHPLSRRIKLNAGVRFSSVSLKAQTTNEQALITNADLIDLNNAAVNGALGAVFNRSEKTKISYNISSGFRAPNVDDVGKLFEVGNRLTVPNPDLKPEYSLSNELSLEQKANRLHFKATVFYSRLFDAIVDGPFTLDGSTVAVIEENSLTVSARVNTGKAVVYGTSAMANIEFADHWAFSKTISYTDGRDISNDEPLRHTTPIFGKAAIIFKKAGLRSECYLEYNTDRKREDIPSSEIVDKPYLYTANGTPGWVTINWKWAYDLGEKWSLNGGVENILDKHYRPYTSGISAPGRNFILSIRVSL